MNELSKDRSTRSRASANPSPASAASVGRSGTVPSTSDGGRSRVSPLADRGQMPYPFLRANSSMKAARAWAPSTGMAL